MASLGYEYRTVSRMDPAELEHEGAAKLEQVAIPLDVYSLFVHRLAFLWDPGRPRGGPGEDPAPISFPFLSFLHGAVLYLGTVGLQLAITCMLYLRAEDLEVLWENKHFLEMFDVDLRGAADTLRRSVRTGHEPGILTSPDGGLLKVCSTAISNQRYIAFYYLMIFIWYTKMTSEFRDAISFGRKIVHLPNSEDGEVFDKGRTIIVALQRWQKAVVLTFTVLVRIIIATVIMYSGGKFIMLQTSTLTLILKSLCMKFVIELDEMFLKSFTTSDAKEKLKNVKLSVAASHSWELWDSGLGGLVCIAFPAACCALFCFFVFGGLMDLRVACHEYNSNLPCVIVDCSDTGRRLFGDFDL